MRITGQLVISKVIEKFFFLNVEIISVNTDSVTLKLKKTDLHLLDLVRNEIKEELNFVLEDTFYDKLIFKNVNSYLGVTTNGKVKQKGIFVEKPVLGNSTDELVIAKALNAYFVNNISPKEFITNPDKYGLHIYSYCCSNKISKDFTVMYNNQIQQQLNRYYFSKNSPYLYKQKKGGTLQHVNVGEGVELFNTYVKKEWKDYNINYNYYIRKTQKIIDELNLQNQISLF